MHTVKSKNNDKGFILTLVEL